MHSYPSARTASSAARMASAGRAASLNWLSANAGSPGFGDSFLWLVSACVIAAAGAILYFAIMARASASVVGSGTVGHEPIADGSSPGTYEIAIVQSFAGCAGRARRPPLMRE